MRLNKYLAHCGVGGRREAESLIRKGKVKVNDVVIDVSHTEVAETDVVKYNDKVVTPQENHHYWVINKSLKIPLYSGGEIKKPSVQDLLKKQLDTPLKPVNDVPEGIFCGILVLSSDPSLIDHLTSSKHKVKSTFQCVMEKPLDDKDIIRIKEFVKENNPGLSLLGIGFPEENDHQIIGLDVLGGTATLWAGIFTHLGYPMKRMDCTFYGGVTKKDLKRDWSRTLSEKEVVFLKHFSS
jgi:23S rRNA pseudouridine2605 synthase